MYTWLFFGLAFWGIYRRIKGLVGKQLYKKARTVVRVSLLLVTLGLIILPRMYHSFIAILVGLLVGGIMLTITCHSTKLMVEGTAITYRMNPYLGTIVLALVIFRFINKLPVIITLTDWLSHSRNTPPDLSKLSSVMDPVSVAIVIVMLTYFLGFNTFLLIAANRLQSKLYANDSSSQE